jgi:hypothetical protein
MYVFWCSMYLIFHLTSYSPSTSHNSKVWDQSIFHSLNQPRPLHNPNDTADSAPGCALLSLWPNYTPVRANRSLNPAPMDSNLSQLPHSSLSPPTIRSLLPFPPLYNHNRSSAPLFLSWSLSFQSVVFHYLLSPSISPSSTTPLVPFELRVFPSLMIISFPKFHHDRPPTSGDWLVTGWKVRNRVLSGHLHTASNQRP